MTHNKCGRICGKLLALLIVLIALFMGVLATVASNLPDYWLNIVGVVARFFDVALPILAVGALLKYICSCPHKHACTTTDDSKK